MICLLKFEYTVHKYHLQISQYTDNHSHPPAENCILGMVSENRQPTEAEYQMILKLMQVDATPQQIKHVINESSISSKCTTSLLPTTAFQLHSTTCSFLPIKFLIGLSTLQAMRKFPTQFMDSLKSAKLMPRK